MTVLALVSGTLFRRPEERVAKSGRNYVTATIKAAVGSELQFWNVISFSDSACAELLRLDEGDAVSVQGSLKIERYERSGETRISYSVTADHVLALRQPPRPREKKAAPASRKLSSAPANANAVAHEFDDEVPF